MAANTDRIDRYLQRHKNAKIGNTHTDTCIKHVVYMSFQSIYMSDVYYIVIVTYRKFLNSAMLVLILYGESGTPNAHVTGWTKVGLLR